MSCGLLSLGSAEPRLYSMERQSRESFRIEVGNSKRMGRSSEQKVANSKELGCSREDGLEDEWKAAKFFLAKGPSATLQYLKDEPKALMFALEAQGTDGSAPTTLDPTILMDPALRRKQEAWRNLDGMTRREAKRRFVDLLTTLLPEWREWHRTHVHKSFADTSEDKVGKLLSDFAKRTGFVLKSKL